MRLLITLFTFFVAIGTAHADRVGILSGTASTQDAGELAYVRQVTERCERWLGELGISARTLNDDTLSTESLRATDVLILPYNPTLPPRVWGIVRAYVSRGGKVLVCYSADARLAALLGLKLGNYNYSPEARRWSSIRFTRDAPPHLPAVVQQHSRNLRPVTPASRDARIIARWHRADGTDTQDPAWVLSPRGAWMTHILTEEDAETKRSMLLGLLGHLAPGVWKEAATFRASRAGSVGRYTTLREAFTAIQDTAKRNRREGEVREALHAARQVAGAIQVHLAGRAYVSALKAADDLDLRMRAAYGLAQAPRANEFRAVWDHEAMGLHPGGWPRTAKLLHRAGITAVFPNVQWAGAAHYKSGVYPRSATYARDGDQLKACTQAAKEYGLEVHAWKICWNVTRAPERFVEKMRRAGRLQRSASGAELPWLCPNQKANREMEWDAIEELARKHPVDGVHLDYIRYPSSQGCYCEASRADFERGTSIEVARWPADVVSGPHAEAYRKWRVYTISSFVAEASRRVRRARPGAQLSAAVYGAYPDCRRSIAQAWPDWLRDGHMDFVCPMIYFNDIAQYRKYLNVGMEIQRRVPGSRVYPGIGVTARESRLDAAATIDQIALARQQGASGFVLYQLDDTLAREILPILRLGTTSQM